MFRALGKCIINDLRNFFYEICFYVRSFVNVKVVHQKRLREI